MLVFACIGHWYASLLYVVPVALIVGALGVQHLRDRRAGIVPTAHRDDLEDGPELEDIARPDASDQRRPYASRSI